MNRSHTAILATILLGYILFINVFSLVDLSSINPMNNGSSQYNRIGFQDTISIKVERWDWYGKTVEYPLAENKKVSTLYLLGLLRMPLRNAHINFIYPHIAMLLFLTFLTVRFIKSEREVD